MKMFLFFIMYMLSLNAFAQLNPNARTEELAAFRSDLELKIDKTPYYSEEHTSIKRYFNELQSLNSDLEFNRRYLRKFNDYIRSSGVENFCNKTLLEHGKWTELVRNCTKNNFFLCTEDVKLYPSIKTKFFTLLDEDIQKHVLDANNCK